jgi:hypothetical protein
MECEWEGCEGAGLIGLIAPMGMMGVLRWDSRRCSRHSSVAGGGHTLCVPISAGLKGGRSRDAHSSGSPSTIQSRCS